MSKGTQKNLICLNLSTVDTVYVSVQARTTCLSENVYTDLNFAKLTGLTICENLWVTVLIVNGISVFWFPYLNSTHRISFQSVHKPNLHVDGVLT